MRYASGHKEETRRKIVDIAARRFREEGIEAVGVASLMADAGLTHGGFYAHFKSKEELAAAAIAQGMGESGDRIFAHAGQAEDKLGAYIRAYLSPAHRDAAGSGCAFSTLAPEAARGEDAVRGALSGRIEPYLDRIGQLLPTTDPDLARSQATALFSLLLGNLQLARLTEDPALSDSILEDGVSAALSLASQFKGV